MASGSRKTINRDNIESKSILHKLSDIPDLFIKVLEHLDQDGLVNLAQLGDRKLRQIIYNYVKTPDFLKIGSPNDIFDFITLFVKNENKKYQSNIIEIIRFLDNKQNLSSIDYNRLHSLYVNINNYYDNPKYLNYLQQIKTDVDNEIKNRFEYYTNSVDNVDLLVQQLENKIFTLDEIDKMIEKLNEEKNSKEEEYYQTGNQEHGLRTAEELIILNRKLDILNDPKYKAGLKGGKSRQTNKEKLNTKSRKSKK